MYLPKNEGGNFEQTPAGTFIARCYRFLDLGSHEQTFQGESKGLKRLVMIGFELPTELMEDGRPFTINKRYTWSTHEKSNMRKDLESWRGARFNDSDFGPDGFDVRNLLGVPATLTIVHSENDGKSYSNIASIGKAMKGVEIPAQVNQSVYLSLEKDFFDGSAFDGLSDKLKDFIRETPEYRRLTDRSQSYADQKSNGSYHAPLDPSQEIESSGPREFAPLEDEEIPF
ncbi:MAG TPA: hypothetical protein PLV87_08040 [Opitutaceae bacterium]|nr:hypothetical protein [Opitutaceae bacterium]